MSRPASGLALIALIVIALIIVHGALFTVDPTEQALVLRFGEPLVIPAM